MQRGSIYNVSVKWIFWGGLFFGVERGSAGEVVRGCKGCIVRRVETVAGSIVEDKSWDGLIWSKLLV